MSGNEPSHSLAEHAAEIRRLGKRVVADVIEIGARLTECKRICGHGNWLPWLDREFGWTEMTATRYINVYDMSKSNKLLDLELPISGLYLLAAPSTTDAARNAVLDLAANGETLKHSDVKEIIDSAKRGIVTGVAMAPYAERGLDLYETPAPAVHALLDVEKLPRHLWEISAGRGAIVRVLRERGHKVVASDIANYGDPTHFHGRDFLIEHKAPDGCEAIITNPPFMHANAFVRHALTLVPRVVMLLRLAFLEGQGRSDILDGGQLARVYVFRNRLPIHRDGYADSEAISALAMAWFIWERHHRGPIELRRISWKPSDDSVSAAADAQVAS